MPETETFHLAPPTEEDLAVAEAAWRSGHARYAMRTDDIWWRGLRLLARPHLTKHIQNRVPQFVVIFVAEYDFHGGVRCAYRQNPKILATCPTR